MSSKKNMLHPEKKLLPHQKKTRRSKNCDEKKMSYSSTSLSVSPVRPSSSFIAASFAASVILSGTILIRGIPEFFLCNHEPYVLSTKRLINSPHTVIFSLKNFVNNLGVYRAPFHQPPKMNHVPGLISGLIEAVISDEYTG
jgi:purine-cytosine permease-like protein